MRKGRQFWLTCVAATLLPFFLISPNPFGNSPDVIVDESYFLSSALSALQNKTLPGWDFIASGAYYGGPQTYLVTAATAVVVGGIVLSTGSIADAELYVATHIGSLTHIVRVVNGLTVSILLWLLLWGALKIKNEDTKRRLWLIVLLLLGNSLFVSMAHTGKVWAMQMVFDIAAAMLVFLRERGVVKRGYITALLLLTILSASQTVTGIFTGVWIVYAWYLRHFSLSDLWKKMVVMFPVAVAAVVLQVSIFYRSLHIADRISSSLTNINGTAFLNDTSVDLVQRFWWPIEVAFQSQPIIVIGFVLLVLYWIILKGREFFGNRLLHIGVANGFLALLFFHGLLGLGSLTRLILPLTVSLTVSVVILLPQHRFITATFIALSLVLALFVGFQTIKLWWQPSTEQRVTDLVIKEYNDPNIAIYVRSSRFSLPANRVSLEYLSPQEQKFGRNLYLLKHPDSIGKYEKLSSLSIKYLSSTTPPYQDLTQKGYTVFELASDCFMRCTEEETNAQLCRQISASACGERKLYSLPQEIPTILDMVYSKMLGRPFVIRPLIESRK